MFFFRKRSRIPVSRKVIPNVMLNPVFGKVSYERVKSNLNVTFTILMPRIGEGWQTGIALDASASMKTVYGKRLIGEIPRAVQRDYIRKGWMRKDKRDGDRLLIFEPQAYEDALAKGYLSHTENLMQAECRTFIQYLADRLDADGGTTVIYWACGKGEKIEVLGDVQGADCATLAIEGPQKAAYGSGTQLLPALRYFVERFAEASHGMYIFITDGRVEDLPAVKRYCTTLAQQITHNQRHPLKCILIGIGSQIDQKQMAELDHLDTGTGVDLWDYKLAADMRQVTEIFAELVDESVIVAPVATIYDDRSNVVQRFTDGLPARVQFSVPQTCEFFELEVAGQDRIRQSLRIREG
jgi:hypothetical protein